MVIPLTVDQTLDLAAQTRRVLAPTRSLIAVSRRLLNPWWGVSGGSDGDSIPLADEPESVQLRLDRLDELGRLVRDKLARDALFPLLSFRCWAGPPTGQICVVCCRAIVAATQCEIEGPQGVVYAHFTCQGVWLRESQHHPHPKRLSRVGPSRPRAAGSRIELPTSAEPPQPHCATGVVYIDRQASGSPQSPSAFRLSFGGATDGVGTLSLGRAVGLDPLATLLKRIGVSPADVDTALDALAAHPRHQITNVRLTPEVLRKLGL